MACFTCAFIKKDNIFVEIGAMTLLGVIGTGNWYCSSHSAKIYSHNYQMRQKRKAEGLQPEIPEAPISESYDSSALIHKYLFPASSQLFADSIQIEVLGDRVVIRGSAPEPPRIYEAPISKSSDEDFRLDLFGD
ncbi:hypothetical protein GLOIN_2v1805909 [Rhizophagus clarus]|uniref:Uncharacterized protein n=1 Tax=Rhizophagus clarus TaxID=94130 RepID=A0A8H3LZI3_9GLOM|nr:hypothetical protein GLOIN_2v1805909 [Rhizophagus clarus]